MFYVRNESIIMLCDFARNKEYRVISMMRSGHHAVIHWMLHNLKNTIFVNDFFRGFNYMINETILEKDLICNFEDFTYERFLQTIKTNKINFGAKKIFNIVILRDPYNLFASRLKYFYLKRFNNNHPYCSLGWISRVAKDNFVSLCNLDFIFINFNQWHKDEEYRKHLSVLLDLDGYKRLDQITHQGGGSSFSGMAFKPSEMNLEERYLSLYNKPEKVYFKDIELFGVDDDGVIYDKKGFVYHNYEIHEYGLRLNRKLDHKVNPNLKLNTPEGWLLKHILPELHNLSIEKFSFCP